MLFRSAGHPEVDSEAGKQIRLLIEFDGQEVHETRTLENGEKQAIDSMPYSEHEIERIGRIGFETAQKRRKKLCCVDKANILDTSRLWRSVMHRLQAEYPDVEYSEMFVDNCAMQIVKNPAQFDVIVTENMFGDILSDRKSTRLNSSH